MAAESGRLIDALASGEEPLTRINLSPLVERVLAIGNPDLCTRLILAIHGRGGICEAREIARRCAEQFPGDTHLAHVRNLVAPPRLVPPIPAVRIDRRADLTWLAGHAAEYPGEWLVLSGGNLWGHSSSLAEARERARAAGLLERPFIHHVPAA